MKKGQMEIMGLAVVVILIVLGLLFAVRFVILKPDEGFRGDYVDSQLAANTLNTLLLTDTNCLSISVSELLEDASRYIPLIECGALPSSEYTEEFIGDILRETLDPIKKSYYFFASTPSKTKFIEIGEDRTTSREVSTHFLPSANIGETITVSLYIYS